MNSEGLNSAAPDAGLETPAESSVIMNDGTNEVTVTSTGGSVFGAMSVNGQGGNIIRHDMSGNVLPNRTDGVQYPAPGMATYGGDVVVRPQHESPQDPTTPDVQ